MSGYIKDLHNNLFDPVTKKFAGVIGPNGEEQLTSSSSLSAPVAFTTRALTSADAGASFTVSSAQTATLATGFGTTFSCAFYNTSASAVVLTITAPAGVTINGVTGGSITRTIPAYGVTAIQAAPTAEVYVAPGA
jgi:hypothetical protein